MRPFLLIISTLILPTIIASSSLVAPFSRRECSSETPVCRSDRFDVVLSHYDEYNCKVFKCKCKEPVGRTCSQGLARLLVDSDGCQYYDCQLCPQRPICPGSQMTTFRGNDANGCPLHVCECTANPSQPQCGPNQQVQLGADSSGCPYYLCQQTKIVGPVGPPIVGPPIVGPPIVGPPIVGPTADLCPAKPTCLPNQQLVSVGPVGDCQVFKCECLTPAKMSCSVGSQSRLQDDGLGCQVYKCIENRSPCPPAPVCPSSHQMVSQEGVDADNCIKYVCKCIPLAPIACPPGFLQTLATDDTSGCQHYKCNPDCELKPNCLSIYQEGVISGTRNNGCPTYTCQCKTPEVTSCNLANAHLVPSKANDGSNCDIYLCETGNGNTRSCGSVPNCPIGSLAVLSSYDAYGCPVYLCSGGSLTNCPAAPVCGFGELLQVVGRDTSGCPQRICYRSGCPVPPDCGSEQAVFSQYLNSCPVYVCQDSRSCPPVPACLLGQVSFQVGYVSRTSSCPLYVCQPSFCSAPEICPANQSPNYVTVGNGCVSVICGNTRSCQGVPSCRPGETPQEVGTDSRSCTRYVCYRFGCQTPPTCPIGQVVSTIGYDANNCAVFACQNDNDCPAPPICLASEGQLYIGQDANLCPLYLCHRMGCNLPPSCTYGKRLVASGTTFGCPSYSCQSTTRSCPLIPICAGSQKASVVAYDSSSCPVYSCLRIGDELCASQLLPSCPLGQIPISAGTNTLGCPVYICQFAEYSVCAYPPVCSSGRAAPVIGRDGNNCPIYDSCLNGNGLFRSDLIDGNIGAACPPQPECQYQQFRIRSQDPLRNGQVCNRYTCINLGDYSGHPPKCRDNPTYCDISQSVETYVDRKLCQRVECKAPVNSGLQLTGL